MSERSRTALGFDYGQARIGVAVGAELTASARPLTTLKTQRQEPPWSAIDRLIDDWRPEVLIVGVPYHSDGSANSMTRAALNFGRELAVRFNRPVATIDERLSSFDARARLRLIYDVSGRRLDKTKSSLDAMAAALILESWLQEQKTPPS